MSRSDIGIDVPHRPMVSEIKQLGGRNGKRGGDQAVIQGRIWRGMPATIPVL